MSSDSSRYRQQFFDARSKYFNFVHSTDEKSRVAFYLAQQLQKRAASSPAAGLQAQPFYILDAGIGEGTIIATFLSAVHQQLKNTPIIVTGKEISADDVQIVCSYLPDRFAEHRSLVFNITNLTYHDLLALANDDRSVNFEYHCIALRGGTSYEFAQQLSGLSSFINEHWALNISKQGTLAPKRKIFLTLYRDDHAALLKPFLPTTKAALGAQLAQGSDHIIASQPFRLRQDRAIVCQQVLAPLLRQLKAGGECFLFYSSGQDFSKKLLAHWYPHIDAFANTEPQHLLAALAKTPRFNLHDFAHAQRQLRFGFKNFNLEQKEFSLTNALSLWNAVTYVGQISDNEQQALTIDEAFIDKLSQKLASIKRLTFKNHVIHFTRKHR